jgi:hypothetical protein
MADTEMVKETETEQVEEVAENEEIVEQPEQEEEFDKERAMATIKNLRKFEKDAKKLEQKLAHYEQQEEERKKAELSEIDRLKLEKQEAEQKLAELTRKEQRREIAGKHKLPEALADRIKGETPEEMEADAKTLFDSLPKNITTKTGVTNPGGNSKEPSYAEPKIDPFDAGFVRSHGGGAVENK